MPWVGFLCPVALTPSREIAASAFRSRELVYFFPESWMWLEMHCYIHMYALVR